MLNMRAIAPIKLSLAFAKIFVPTSPILRFPRPLHPTQSTAMLPTPSALTDIVYQLKDLFAVYTSLPDSAYLSFASVDWARLVISVILCVRLSFPLIECIEWDYAWGRRELEFSKVLAELCSEESELTPQTSGKVDVLSASRVVLKVVKEKYDQRVGVEESMKRRGGLVMGCPMLDGSMSEWLPEWDGDLASAIPKGSMLAGNTNTVGDSTTHGEQQPQQQQHHLFNDLWNTMTGAWTGDDTSGRNDSV